MKLEPDSRWDTANVEGSRNYFLCFAHDRSDRQTAHEVEREMRDEIVRCVNLHDELVGALRAMDGLMDNLWQAVPWAKTFNLDAAALNTAPQMAKAVLAKLDKKGN